MWPVSVLVLHPSLVGMKHCQRHNGPEDWVLLLPKLLILVISQGQTQNLIKFHLQNIDQAPTSKSWHQQTSASRLNLKFKILAKPGFRISTKIQLTSTSIKHQQQNTDQTRASNLALTSYSWPNLVLKVWTKVPSLIGFKHFPVPVIWTRSALTKIRFRTQRIRKWSTLYRPFVFRLFHWDHFGKA